MKKHFNRFFLLYFVYLLFYFFICLSVIYAVNYFYVFPVICYIKTRPDAKFSIVPEEGWFGQPKYSTRSKKAFYVMSVSAFIFFILFVKPIRSLLIQRIQAGSSFRLLAFETFYRKLNSLFPEKSQSPHPLDMTLFISCLFAFCFSRTDVFVSKR